MDDTYAEAVLDLSPDEFQLLKRQYGAIGDVLLDYPVVDEWRVRSTADTDAVYERLTEDGYRGVREDVRDGLALLHEIGALERHGDWYNAEAYTAETHDRVTDAVRERHKVDARQDGIKSASEELDEMLAAMDDE